MDIVLESISACSMRCKLVPRFYNLTKKEGGNSFRRWIVVTHKVPFKILLKYAKPVLRGKRKREGRVERSRVSVSLFPALCVGYMFIANGGRQVERKVTSRINRAKTDLFIVLFPQLSRKRMHKLENASRGKNALEILKLPRFVCIPVAALHVKIPKLLSSLVINLILAANGTSLLSVKSAC